MTQEVIPEVDLFADRVEVTSNSVSENYGEMATDVQVQNYKIADSTKEAVGAYIKMDDDTKKVLTDLYVNSTKITDETVKNLVDSYKNMSTQIKTGIDKQYSEQLKTMQDFFKKSDALSSTEEEKALADLKQNNANKKKEVDNYTKQIQQILQKASKENRELTLEEQQQINTIQEQMKTNAVKSLSDSEVESKVILQRHKDYGARITAEQASAEIKNANAARDKSVAAANEQYEKTVASIIRMRDETHTITSDQADKLIADAKRQKEDSITNAEELRSTVVTKITSMNSDISTSVDTTTGDILTWWDKLKNWWAGWQPDTKSFNYTTSYGGSSDVGEYTTSFGVTMNANATGTNSFEGGLTTMNERGYEIFNLPRGSRIYNHQASEDMVIKTAQEVARNVISNMNINNGGEQTIIVPIYLDGKQIGRSVAKYVDEENGFRGWN